MELIFALLGTLAVGFLGRYLSSLVLERASPISEWIIRSIGRLLPTEIRDDRIEQWCADNYDIEGPAWKLLNAALCLFAAIPLIGERMRKAIPLSPLSSAAPKTKNPRTDFRLTVTVLKYTFKYSIRSVRVLGTLEYFVRNLTYKEIGSKMMILGAGLIGVVIINVILTTFLA